MTLLLSIQQAFTDLEFLGEPVSHYLWFAGIVLATLLLKKPMAALLTRLSGSFTAKFSYTRHRAAMGEMLFKPMERLLQAILYFVAANQLSTLLNSVEIEKYLYIGKKVNFDLSLGTLVDHVFLLLFIIFLTRVITRFIDFFYYLSMGKAEAEKNQSQQQLLPLIKEITKLVAWTMSIFAILGFVFHVNVPALITGLGIGGVAIALAGKETVENFFAAFTLLSDKPFLTGDMIKIGDIEGVVERIGFRSTRLRHADGAAYIVPNQHLVSQNLINLTTRVTRGIKVTANIRYGIDATAISNLTANLKKTLRETTPVKEPVIVVLENFDKDTMQLMITYHLPNPLPEGANLLELKHEISVKIFDTIGRYAQFGSPQYYPFPASGQAESGLKKE